MALFRLVDMLREIAGVLVDPNVASPEFAAELVVMQLGEKYQQVVKRCLDCANDLIRHHGEMDFDEEVVDRCLTEMLQKLQKCAEASDIFS